jgi:hypothetical protein
MFDKVYESMQKTAEANLQMQQEMLKKWVGLWGLNGTTSAAAGEQAQTAKNDWGRTMQELVKRQRDIMETQFKAGMANLEKAFQIGEARTPEEVRVRSLELWQKCFETMRQSYEAQIREFQFATDKWLQLVSHGKGG